MAAIFNRFYRRALAWLSSALSPRDAVALSFVLVLAVVSFWPDPTVADHVQADTPDYVLPSLNFLRGEGFVLIANGHKYPPTHTFGLSVLLTPVYEVLGLHVGNGGYLVFIFGLVTILLTYRLANTLFDRRVAVVACVLLALAGQFRYYAKIISPDGAVSAFFCLSSLVLLLGALRTPQSSLAIWALLGQILGFAVTVRPDNVLLLVPTTIVLFLYIRGQNRARTKAMIFASGIFFWGMMILLANFLYTGDWFRTGYAVNFSAQNDRRGGSVSWRYFLNPSFRESNFIKLLQGAPIQWSLFGAEVTSVKRYFYYTTDVFLVVGLAQAWRVAKRNSDWRDFLTWSLVWFLSLVLFLGCYFFPTDNPRYLQRIVPYVCLFTAIGFVTSWDWVARLGGAVSSSWVRALRILLMVGFGGAGLYMFLHPYIPPLARLPQSAYLQHVNDMIPEKNAMILTDWSLPWMEYFVARDSQRTLIPLNRFDSGADSYVQWKRPPHPEWITEDCTNRDNTATVRYRRMYENGAQDIYPHTVFPDPSVINAALRAGRSVYLVTQGGYTIGDKDALILIIYRYNLEPVESGWVPGPNTPKEATGFTENFVIARVSAKRTLGIRLRNIDEDQIAFETDRGVRYTFLGHVEKLPNVPENHTRFRITWEDERHSEQILRFTPEGLIQTSP
ncbi:MAG TPA: glycosyltransferase family 39 protein [Verrucomicrobiae bacterium]|nr:glycosyltransferase family 39 protein [Verrucomicrobiae bacterium]